MNLGGLSGNLRRIIRADQVEALMAAHVIFQSPLFSNEMTKYKGHQI
jgi:hypothetical protein